MNYQFDVIVVGSGPAGVHAAYPLVEAGLKVAIIDGGLNSTKQDEQLDEFFEANLTKNSHYYDLIKKSSYVFNKTYRLLKIKSNIEIIQTLAKGGLSEVWHGICDYFTEDELKAIGLPEDEMRKEYKEISRIIKFKPRLSLDLHGKLILSKSKNNTYFKNNVYQASVALSYRTSVVVNTFKKFKNFTYIPNQLVFTVKERPKDIEITSYSIGKKQELKTLSNYVILAAGSINTTRILLRSLQLFNHKTTFLTKANYLVVSLHLKTLIKKNVSKKSSFGQLVIASKEIDKNLGSFFVQLYRFNPLMLHAALKYIPLPKFIALPMLTLVAPSLVIVDLRFSSFESKNKFCRLKKEGNKTDVLEIFFQESSRELKSHKNEYGKLSKKLWSLGLFPIRSFKGYTSSHYAGGVPFQQAPGKLSSDVNGKLHQASRIYIADSSTWRVLPAKPPTMTIMANASRVGKNVLKRINKV